MCTHIYNTYTPHTRMYVDMLSPVYLPCCVGTRRYTRFNNAVKPPGSTAKTLLAVGGWNFGTAKMTAMLSTKGMFWGIASVYIQ